MIEASGHFSFAEEARPGFRQIILFEFFGQRNRLDRHDAIYLRIASQVDDAHGPFAELALDLVATERARGRAHGRLELVVLDRNARAARAVAGEPTRQVVPPGGVSPTGGSSRTRARRARRSR